jgi:hypothetical protein
MSMLIRDRSQKLFYKNNNYIICMVIIRLDLNWISNLNFLTQLRQIELKLVYYMNLEILCCECIYPERP